MGYRILFFHNRHDNYSLQKLHECTEAGLQFDVVDVYAGAEPDFAGFKIRALPSVGIVGDISGQLLCLFEEENIVPAVIKALNFVDPQEIT